MTTSGEGFDGPRLVPLNVSVGYLLLIGFARAVYIYTVHCRIFGDFPAKNTVHISVLRNLENLGFVSPPNLEF
jgi:hypothetical protein